MEQEKRNAINWFEIPAANFERAKKFYDTILGASMHTEDMMGFKMAFLPCSQGEVGGAVVAGPGCVPSTDGVVIYLNCNPDLSSVLGRVEASGGKINRPKTQVTPEIGYMAVIIDSEGNKIALHSQK